MRPARKRLAVAGAVSGVLVGVLAFVLLTRGEVYAPLRWYLDSVSADGRTLGVVHDVPGCQTKPGGALARERARTVSITIPQVDAGVDDEAACAAVYVARVTRVRLKRPLSTRRLEQPSDGVGSRGFLVELSRLANRDCPSLVRLEADAPARDLPWVARRLEICNESTPRRVLRLPFLRRARSPADRLPRNARYELGMGPVVTRRAEVRGANRPERMWLVPGPQLSCLYVRYESAESELRECEQSSRVARQGLVVASRCGGLPRRGPVRLAGITPTEVGRVRILRDGDVVRTAKVLHGAWAARIRRPEQVAYQDVRVPINDPAPYRC